LKGTDSEPPETIMTSFIEQFYSTVLYIPPLILMQHKVFNETILESWLSNRRGSKVRLEMPKKGRKRKLIEMVEKNAKESLKHQKIKEMASIETIAVALEELVNKLKLASPPTRMEAYDISNIQGSSAVGSLVFFENGRPKPAYYRRFKIKAAPIANDYAMLREVIDRRFSRLTKGTADSGWAILPDLILIDGGIGQLNSALKAMEINGTDNIPVIGLAKENEAIYIPGNSRPIVLPSTSPGLKLLQYLRDEAHRFAISYHRKVREKKTFHSILDNIPGIGPKRKKALIKYFGSTAAIKQASTEEITKVSNINCKLALKLKELL
jgi:excinuclease ABC subunit C